jgi:hypothetical protein
LLASGHRRKSARKVIIVNNISWPVAKWRSFGAEYQILTIIPQAPLLRVCSDREEQDG